METTSSEQERKMVAWTGKGPEVLGPEKIVSEPERMLKEKMG